MAINTGLLPDAAVARTDVPAATERVFTKEDGQTAKTRLVSQFFGATSTQTNLNSATHAHNTTNKFPGKMVFVTTSNKPVWASGSTANAVWVDATGATAYTPV